MVGPSDTSHCSLVILISPGYNHILVLVIVISIVEATFYLSFCLITNSKYDLLKEVLVLIITDNK